MNDTDSFSDVRRVLQMLSGGWPYAVNHCCSVTESTLRSAGLRLDLGPNLELVSFTVGDVERLAFVATRDIAPGEVLTWDYQVQHFRFSFQSGSLIVSCSRLLPSFRMPRELSASAPSATRSQGGA